MPRVTTADTSVGALGVGSRVPVIATLAANPATPLAGGRTIVMTCRGGKCCASGEAIEPTSFSYGHVGSELAAGTYGVAYGNGTWVAGGDITDYTTYWDSVVTTATDPTGAWTPTLNVLGDSGYDYNEVDTVTFADGKFVIGGLANGYAKIAYSTDGSSWTVVDLGMSLRQARGPGSIAYGNGMWLAVMMEWGSPYRTYLAYASSLDGPWTVELKSWYLASAVRAHMCDFGDGAFRVVDKGNGLLWSATTPAGSWTSTFIGYAAAGIVYGNGGAKGLYSVPYPLDYYDTDATPGDGCWLEVKFNRTWYFYAIVDEGSFLSIPNGVEPYAVRYVSAAAYGGGKYVLVGQRWNPYPTSIQQVALVFGCS